MRIDFSPFSYRGTWKGRTFDSAQKNHLARIWFALSACSAWMLINPVNPQVFNHVPLACFLQDLDGQEYCHRRCPSFRAEMVYVITKWE